MPTPIGVGYRGAWANGGQTDSDSIARQNRTWLSSNDGMKAYAFEYLIQNIITRTPVSDAFGCSVRSLF